MHQKYLLPETNWPKQKIHNIRLTTVVMPNVNLTLALSFVRKNTIQMQNKR